MAQNLLGPVCPVPLTVRGTSTNERLYLVRHIKLAQARRYDTRTILDMVRIVRFLQGNQVCSATAEHIARATRMDRVWPHTYCQKLLSALVKQKILFAFCSGSDAKDLQVEYALNTTSAWTGSATAVALENRAAPMGVRL